MTLQNMMTAAICYQSETHTESAQMGQQLAAQTIVHVIVGRVSSHLDFTKVWTSSFVQYTLQNNSYNLDMDIKEQSNTDIEFSTTKSQWTFWPKLASRWTVDTLGGHRMQASWGKTLTFTEFLSNSIINFHKGHMQNVGSFDWLVWKKHSRSEHLSDGTLAHFSL